MVKISSSGIKIVLTCITHNYMSYWTPRRSFRHPWGPHNGPKHHPNGPRGTWRARRVQIWSQLPPIGLTGLESWLPDTLTWYWASSGLPGTPKGPDLAQNAPFGGPNRPLRLDLVPTATNWSDWAGITLWPDIGPLLDSRESQKGQCFHKTALIGSFLDFSLNW